MTEPSNGELVSGCASVYAESPRAASPATSPSGEGVNAVPGPRHVFRPTELDPFQ
jgi:hypothetical protein